MLSAPRTDPSVRNLRTGLLPRVFDGEASADRINLHENRDHPNRGESLHMLQRAMYAACMPSAFLASDSSRLAGSFGISLSTSMGRRDPPRVNGRARVYAASPLAGSGRRNILRSEVATRDGPERSSSFTTRSQMVEVLSSEDVPV